MSKLNSRWEDVLSRHIWRYRGAWIQEATDLVALLWDERDSTSLRKQTVATLLVGTICLHLVLIWIFLRALPPIAIQQPIQPVEVEISRSSSPPSPRPPAPTLTPPSTVDIQEPQIELAPQSDSVATDAGSLTGQSETIAPRPDPSHENRPFTSANAPAGLRVILRVLIAPEGSVDDAQVSTSCGQPALDQSAIVFVKANWKFLPAITGGNPVPFWTTILVPVMGV